ncbi:[Histone H3]-lysine-36 demethylase [Martiniozyma asiatica (nom. inval.)]|nr:[Histone H3]-lysine-36 demethylase [Martiniozyma asiatica]
MAVRKSKRTGSRVDYEALNQAQFRFKNIHPHISRFNEFALERREPFVHIVDPSTDGRDSYHFSDDDLKQLIMETKLTMPILIRNANPNVENYDERIKLTMNFPNYDLPHLTSLIGNDKKVPVMDVMTQNNNNWTMEKWCDYFMDSQKKKINNVISLEISDTQIGTEIQLPKIVKELDFINHLNADFGIVPPKIQKYILMSVKNCFTDFHIDFAATSVYYSPILGHKQFILIPPLSKNLQVYKKWCLSPDQSTTWLPDLIKPVSKSESDHLNSSQKIPKSYNNNGFVIDVKPGDLLFLPSGWIHSVLTLEDSIVFGGNFLNLLSIKNHLNTYQVEIDTNVPDQYKFPKFINFIWLFAWSIERKRVTEGIKREQEQEQEQKTGDPHHWIQNIDFSHKDTYKYDDYELECLKTLLTFLQEQWKMIQNPLDGMPKNSTQKFIKKRIELAGQIKSQIPHEVEPVGDFLERLKGWIERQYNGNGNGDNAANKTKKREFPDTEMRSVKRACHAEANVPSSYSC